MKIFVINLKARPDRLAFISEQLKNYTWQRFDAVNGNDLSINQINEMGFHPFNDWIDPISKRKITMGEMGAAISHFRLWELCADLNEPILILEDDSELVGNINFQELDELCLEYDIIYLDHREMFPDKAIVGNTLVRPYYPYWNNAYVITPGLAKHIIKSQYRYNIIPVDELFPILSNVDYDSYCLGKSDTFKYLKSLLMSSPSRPVAYKNSVFKQVSRKIFGSDIEYGKQIMQENKITIHVITVATDETKLNYLKTSTDKFNINFKNLGKDIVWEGGSMEGPGGGQKLNLVKDFVSTVSPDDLVLFVDGYDVFINDDLKTIVHRFMEFDCKVLFASEKNCWPDQSLKGLFDAPTDYKYVNSGVYIGYASSICSLIDHYLDNSEDDQLFLQKKYIISKFDKQNDYKIDHENYIFQCLAGATEDVKIKSNKQLVNIATKCCPCILHGNGGEQVKTSFDELFKNLFNTNDSDINFLIPSGYNIVGPEIVELDFLSPEMCAKIIEKAENCGMWQSMNGDKFPAQEMRLRELDINLFELLELHLKNNVYPLIEQYWFPLQMHGLRDAFIIKYSPETQSSLRCHHDASLVSGNVKLNDTYAGGDTFFYRQNYSNINTQVGKMIMWPSQVTHGHEGREVTSGTKYNLVIWTSRRPGDINY